MTFPNPRDAGGSPPSLTPEPGGGRVARPGAYYNENDPFAADWLENLIAAGLIAPGVVDRRSITEVQPDDLSGYAQVHLFAGIGIWSHALRSAGWPDDRPVWTASCPCQPFSVAGQGKGYDDERHLAPALLALVAERAPAIVVGEQVASRSGRDWLSDLRLEMEALGYAVGAADLCAAGAGGAHIRQRLYWGAERLGDADDEGPQGRGRSAGRSGECAVGTGSLVGGLAVPNKGERGRRADDAEGRFLDGTTRGRKQDASGAPGDLAAGGMADARDKRWEGLDALLRPEARGPGAGAADLPQTAGGGEAGGMGHAGKAAREWNSGGVSGAQAPVYATGERVDGRIADGPADAGGGVGVSAFRSRPPHCFWKDADWLLCRDGKWRPVEAGTFPLAYEAAARVGRLRAYGNALDAETAVQFLGAFFEARAILEAEASE